MANNNEKLHRKIFLQSVSGVWVQAHGGLWLTPGAMLGVDSWGQNYVLLFDLELGELVLQGFDLALGIFLALV